MKKCPKCGIMHNKQGTFCSRKCANSRTWSDADNKKKSNSMKGRKRSPQSIESEEKRLESCRETWRLKYEATPFEELGPDSKRRRVKEEQNHCCNRCGLSEWLGEPLVLEIDHKDGNTHNNSRDNLEGLCPNCHSLTETWRGRNKPSRNGNSQVSDEYLLQCLVEAPNIRQGLLKAGLAAKGNNYPRAKALLQRVKE